MDYLEHWKDHTGPFGGAYQWALENLDEGEERVGVRTRLNHFDRVEVYRFKVMRGKNNYIKGRMEFTNGRKFHLDGTIMHLLEAGQRVNAEWVLIEKFHELSSVPRLYWHKTLGRQWIHPHLSSTPPLDPYIALTELAKYIDRHPPNDQGLVKEVFGCTLHHFWRYYNSWCYEPGVAEQIQESYNVCYDIIETEGVTQTALDHLVEELKGLVVPTDYEDEELLLIEEGDEIELGEDGL